MFQSRFKSNVDRQALILDMKSWVFHQVLLSKQYQDEIIVNIRTKVGRLEEDLSIQERKNYRNYALAGCHCLFFFSSLLEFLDTFFLFLQLLLAMLVYLMQGPQPTYSYPMVLKKPPMVGSRGWYTSSISFFMGEDSLQTKTNQNKCQLNIDCQLPLKYKKITIIKQNLDIIFKNHGVIPRVFKLLI